MEHVDWSQFGPLLVVIVAAAGSVIIAGMKVSAAWLNKFAQKIDNEEIRDSVSTTIDVLEDTFREVILNMSESMKTKVADGTLAPAEIKAIQDEVVEQAKKKIAPAILKRAEAHVGNMETFMLSKIAGNTQRIDKVTN